MGQPKALLRVGAGVETFLDRVTRTLLDGGVEEVLVVFGADAALIRARATETTRVTTIPNTSKGS